ncbi:expressed unknown protein [Seminavis robusta]|uniref:50S ribosomal protein L32 n=1 Tax=Seminavis robusta TaxID=568900 RepID=A0A9N8HWU0_9STRA|nr:expressed unknown protein [Seminavis robusta]|eukprot:Sro2305_g322650.1 n/a (109) ;mRNA; f:10566-10892
MILLQSLSQWTLRLCHHFSQPFIRQSACRPLLVGQHDMINDDEDSIWSDALWFAVPKKKVTRSKKRMKTTAQKRIKLKQHIIDDPRTGEPTLRHKLPLKWKDYLPKMD